MENNFAEKFAQMQQERDAEELAQIIEKPDLTPEEIWKITPENFYAWQKKHYYPKIIAHFYEKLKGFEDWLKESKLTENDLIEIGISKFVNASTEKDKKKYLININDGLQKKTVRAVADFNINNRFLKFGQYKISYDKIAEFVGYIDWCHQKKIEIIPRHRNVSSLIDYPSKSSVLTPSVTVSVLDGFNLLKVGGIVIDRVANGPLVRPKHFEFVNAEFLTLKGNIYTMNGETLSFNNSSVDNLYCEKLDFPQIGFTYSTIKNFQMIDSEMKQWEFRSSHLNGKITDSSLSFVDVYGGSFFADYRGCTFFDVTARHSNKNQFGFALTYKTFKKIYADQGDDKSAIEYLLLEKKIERRKLCDGLFKYERRTILNETKWEMLANRTRQFIEKLSKYTSSSLNNVIWGYGRKPSRVMINSAMLIIVFSLIYYYHPSGINYPKNPHDISFFESV